MKKAVIFGVFIFLLVTMVRLPINTASAQTSPSCTSLAMGARSNIISKTTVSVNAGQSIPLVANIANDDNNRNNSTWNSTGGTFSNKNWDYTTWVMPATGGSYTVSYGLNGVNQPNCTATFIAPSLTSTPTPTATNTPTPTPTPSPTQAPSSAPSSTSYKITYKQGAAGRTDNNNTVTASFNNQAYVVNTGNVLAVTVSSKGPNSQVTSVTDNRNNSYIKVIDSSTSDGSSHISVWYTIPLSSQSGYAITATTQGVPATTKMFMNVQDLSDVDRNNPVVASAKSQGTSGALSTGTISAPINSYKIAGYTFSDNTNVVWNGSGGPNGYSAHHRNLEGTQLAPLILLTTGGVSTTPNTPSNTYDAAFTLPNNQSVTWAGLIMAFRVAGSSTPTICDPDPTLVNNQRVINGQDLAVVLNEMAGLVATNKGACLNNPPGGSTNGTALAKAMNIIAGLENPLQQ